MSGVRSSVVTGPDGVARCAWSNGSDDYREYHDLEWGRVVHGDVPLFERLTLEAFQSGLSWLTILRKRDGFRRAFAAFDPATVAGYGDMDLARLMEDSGIVRNRRKIEATITNARAVLALQAVGGDGALDELVWSHAPSGNRRRRPRHEGDLLATTPESTALSKDLKRHGFVFVGPTTMHAAMQACGIVDDHFVGCAVADS